ncbi:MAG TPA: GH32 C-terminal domain-containing protein [Corynebacterium sp.]|nr:GH32 C-terminal domain-containing protein [Corynebacterium sp.]
MAADIHRPEIHVTAETGVLNAPAGILDNRNVWHMFYQFQPKPGGPARWGHAIGSDGPLDWDFCDDVLAPEGNEITLRAGSVVPEGEGIGVYFTSATQDNNTIGYAQATVLPDDCAISDEPSALDGNFHRVGTAVSDREGYTRFRSPCVVPGWNSEDDRGAGHAGFLMLAVSGPMDAPVPVMLTSSDGQEWDFIGPLTFDGTAGIELASLVAPRIMRLRDEVDGKIYDILLVTQEREGIDHSGYLIGQLVGAEFRITRGFTRIDYGHDFTRPRNATVIPGTVPEAERHDQAIMFGLLNGVGRQDDPTRHYSLETEGWVNALSGPRVVTLQGGLLYQTPVSGLPEMIRATRRAQSWTGLCEIPSGASVSVSLFNAEGEVACRITHSGTALTLDRSMDPRFADAPVTAPLQEGDSDSLTIIVDGSTVEVFADGGQVTMASRVYFDGGCSGIAAETTGEAEITRSWQEAGSRISTRS